MMDVRYDALRLDPELGRTVLRPYHLAPEPRDLNPLQTERVQRIIREIGALDEPGLGRELATLKRLFSDRHSNADRFYETRCHDVLSEMGLGPDSVAADRRRLVGAQFSLEYAFAAAALMNPSLTPSPDQSGIKPDQIRVILSLRCVGEGHVSSVAFRQGVVQADGTLRLDPGVVQAQAGLGAAGPRGSTGVGWDAGTPLEQRLIFPLTPAQRNGIEDLRLVRFVEDDGSPTWFGSYTAYSGAAIASEMLVTQDFERFDLYPMVGAAARNKGMALFPRRIDGAFAMIGRQDNENLFLLKSDDPFRWDHGVEILGPRYDWERVQIGNCGSPIEIDEGWLLLTHGVGSVRRYTLGAALLDKTDPSKVLARTVDPLMEPRGQDRDGYVPNVLYTCGALAHNGRLVMPYGIADRSVGCVSLSISDLLARMH